MKSDDFLSHFEEKWTILQSSTYRQRGKCGFCMKITNFEWKMNEFYYYFHDNLYTDSCENNDFGLQYNDFLYEFWIKMNDFAMFC